MEITDFLTQNFLSSFTGTLVAVELIVYITKDLYIIKKIPTKLYTFLLATVHLLIVKGTIGELAFKVECIYRLFINALVVTLILCGGYDTIMQKIQGVNSGDSGDDDKLAEINEKEETVKSNDEDVNVKNKQ